MQNDTNVVIEDIYFIFKEGRESIIKVKNREYYANRSLVSFKKEFNDSLGFVNRSLLVNYKYVVNVDDDFIIVNYDEGERRINLGKSESAIFKTEYKQYLEKKGN